MIAHPFARQAQPRELPTRDKGAVLVAEERPVLVFDVHIPERIVVKPARFGSQKMIPNGFNGTHSQIRGFEYVSLVTPAPGVGAFLAMTGKSGARVHIREKGMHDSGVLQVEQASVLGVPLRRTGKPKPPGGLGASAFTGCWDGRLGAEKTGLWAGVLEGGFFAWVLTMEGTLERWAMVARVSSFWTQMILRLK